jgi:taurine transport system substrate-binding protein
MERHTSLSSMHLSRRRFITQSAALAAAVSVGLTPRRAFSANAVANLGHYASPNPQTYSKVARSYEKVFSPKAGVNYVMVNSSGQVINFMTAGSVDISNIGSSGMVIGSVNGAPISMIYVQKYITDSEALVVRTDRGINSVADLKGKKIGTSYVSSTHFALLMVLKKAGLSQKDVEILNTPPDQALAAWRRGAIDAAYMWEPVLSQIAEDKGKRLATTGDLLSDGVSVFDAIIVRNEFKEKHPDLVLAYLKEYDRIAQLYMKTPDEVAKFMSEGLQLPLDKAKGYVDTFHPITPAQMIETKWMGKGNPENSGVNQSLMLQAQFLKDQGGIPSVPKTFTRYIDSSFLEKMAS